MEQNRIFQTIASVFACLVLLPCLAITMFPLFLLGAPLFIGLLLPFSALSNDGARAP